MQSQKQQNDLCSFSRQIIQYHSGSDSGGLVAKLCPTLAILPGSTVHGILQARILEWVAISCLTTSNLLWFVDLTFQVPMQYCSLQHWTLLPSPVTSTTGRYFCFVYVSSFFLELFLHWFPVAYWAPTDLGSSSFNVISFCLYILLMGFSRQDYWSDLPFPSPVGHVRPSWVTLHNMAHSFTELDKVVVHVIRLVSFLWFWFSFCLPSNE